MINFSIITAAVEKILRDGLSGYSIERNEKRNEDPSIAAQGKGWIGIYRGRLIYDPHTTGNRPWKVGVEVIVEAQAAHMGSGEDVEAAITAAENEILNVLNNNKNLDRTVLHTMGYEIAYEYNTQEEFYYQSALITVKAEVRA